MCRYTRIVVVLISTLLILLSGCDDVTTPPVEEEEEEEFTFSNPLNAENLTEHIDEFQCHGPISGVPYFDEFCYFLGFRLMDENLFFDTLYSMEPETGEYEYIYTTHPNLNISSISPDGEYMLLTYMHYWQIYNAIYYTDIRGLTGYKRLTLESDGTVGYGYLSPDGYHVLFSSGRDTPHYSGKYELYLTTIDGETEENPARRLTYHNSLIHCYSFSNDGNYIYYTVRDDTAPENYRYYKMALFSGEKPEEIFCSLDNLDDKWGYPLFGGESPDGNFFIWWVSCAPTHYTYIDDWFGYSDMSGEIKFFFEPFDIPIDAILFTEDMEHILITSQMENIPYEGYDIFVMDFDPYEEYYE